MHTSLAPVNKVLRKLCLFKPYQSWKPLPGRGRCLGRCPGRAAHPHWHISYLTAPPPTPSRNREGHEMAPHSLQHRQMLITFTCNIRMLYATTQFSSTFHVDANAYLTCPSEGGIEEDMPCETLAVLEATSGPWLSRAFSREGSPLKLAHLLPHTSTPYTISEPRGS